MSQVRESASLAVAEREAEVAAQLPVPAAGEDEGGLDAEHGGRGDLLPAPALQHHGEGRHQPRRLPQVEEVQVAQLRRQHQLHQQVKWFNKSPAIPIFDPVLA